MASLSKPPPPKKEPPSSASLLPQPPKPTDSTTVGTAQAENPNSAAAFTLNFLSPSPEDHALSKSSHLTRQELLRRRLRHVKRLKKVYVDYFWALMEELRVQYREYYWKYGISPYKEEEEREVAEEREMAGSMNVEGTGETNTNNNSGFLGNNSNNNGAGGGLGGKLGFAECSGGGIESRNRCTFVGCKLKAMALTSFCHLHILSDPHQKLYKACNYVIKSAQAGPILCGKPILRSTVPSLCNVHFQKAQKHVTRALRKFGLNSSSSKLAPKFHVIVAEYVRDIQARRRASQKPNSNIVVKEECGS
ncbi:hypothetical protein V2J09_014482 [Rumex salicifolius]